MFEFMRVPAKASLLAVTSTAAATAATIHVPGEHGSIQEGIDAATDGDEVVVAVGRYYESWIRFRGKAISVRGSSGPFDKAVVHAQHQGPVFVFTENEGRESRLSGFQLTAGESVCGGGLRCENASPTIENCLIYDNRALGWDDAHGGGAHIHGGSPVFLDCTFADNMAEFNGGAIFALVAEVTLIESSFTDNTAVKGSAIFASTASVRIAESDVRNGRGGAFYLQRSDLLGRDLEFAYNTSEQIGRNYAAGIYAWESEVSLLDSVFRENVGASSGAVEIVDNSTGIFRGCEFESNWGIEAGGLEVRNAAGWVTNCIFTANTSERAGAVLMGGGGTLDAVATAFRGGFGRACGAIATESEARLGLRGCLLVENIGLEASAIHSLESSATLVNCTVVEGLSPSGPAVLAARDAMLNIESSILWANDPVQIGADPSASVEVDWSDVEGGFAGEGNIDADPLFHSGLHVDYLLRPLSPCVDAGDPEVEDHVSDWHPRWPNWYPNGARSDMGAYGGTDNWRWIPTGS
ncbi:MAG: hypothetical protein CME06_04660 [Gemmatimonadetes bacterium]|nr:hypothetical protein [Gemmatimonadota bacterium]